MYFFDDRVMLKIFNFFDFEKMSAYASEPVGFINSGFVAL
jgi:hypothetical protein